MQQIACKHTTSCIQLVTCNLGEHIVIKLIILEVDSMKDVYTPILAHQIFLIKIDL
jgi:hypothetical protein